MKKNASRVQIRAPSPSPEPLRAPAPATPVMGFNSQLTEAATGWQILGNGYRLYNPVLMRFHSPDTRGSQGCPE